MAGASYNWNKMKQIQSIVRVSGASYFFQSTFPVPVMAGANYNWSKMKQIQSIITCSDHNKD